MLKVKLETLKHEKNLKIDESFEWEYLDFEGNVYRYSKPVDVNLEVEFDVGKIYAHGKVKTQIIHPCDRCLEPVELDIDGNIEAYYLLERNVKEIESSSGEIGTFYHDPQAEFIDFTDRVIEAIILEIPMKVLCKPDCKGLCPYCGVNLNEHPDHICDQNEDEKKDSPFYVLKKKISFDSKGE